MAFHASWIVAIGFSFGPGQAFATEPCSGVDIRDCESNVEIEFDFYVDTCCDAERTLKRYWSSMPGQGCITYDVTYEYDNSTCAVDTVPCGGEWTTPLGPAPRGTPPHPEWCPDVVETVSAPGWGHVYETFCCKRCYVDELALSVTSLIPYEWECVVENTFPVYAACELGECPEAPDACPPIDLDDPNLIVGS